MPPRTTMTLIPTLLAVAALASCAQAPKPQPDLRYPAPQTSSLDIQLRRHDETQVTLVNTSARAFPAATLWINAQFARDIPPLAVGQSATFDLYTFRNEYGESFRAGGFFSTERPDTVVLAQLAVANELIGLTVVNGKP